MAKSIQNLGLYLTLVGQLDKLARHNRQGSFRTKERYYEAFKRFCAYLADEYHLQKLENISGKHLTSYVLWMQESGKSASTIKTDLAAIRFFHDKMSRPKYQLPSNEELAVELERRCFGGVERALRENAITIKGKGGKVRTVPINEQIAVAMRKQLDRTFRGQKLLVPDDMHTDRAINLLQLFIMKHRDEVRDVGSDRPMAFHGLRHTFAAEKYRELTGNGMSALDAHFAVSRLLGHERADVTNIYLASLPKGERHGK